MNPSTCSAANSVLEAELELAFRQQTLMTLSIAETVEGFYVIARLSWAGDKDWYLTTRRDRSRPRLFRDLHKLNDLLRQSCPTDRVELLRNQRLPDPGE